MVLIFPYDQRAGRSTSKGDLTPSSATVPLVGTNGHDVIKIYLNLIASVAVHFTQVGIGGSSSWVGCQVTAEAACNHERQLSLLRIRWSSIACQR